MDRTKEELENIDSIKFDLNNVDEHQSELTLVNLSKDELLEIVVKYCGKGALIEKHLSNDFYKVSLYADSFMKEMKI